MAFQEMVDPDIKDSTEEAKKHRSSDITAGNSLILRTESGLTDNIEQFLPSFARDLPFSFPTTEIFDIFALSATKKRFQIIEKTSTMATAVYKERYSFKNLLLCCLPPEQRQRTILSAVRMIINVNEISCKRVVTIKGIYGYPQVIMPLISDFQTRLDLNLNSSPSAQKKDTYENLVNDEEETVVTCKHESSSYYQFHKILSSENYTLGKSISAFIQSFSEQYRNPEESVTMLPLPLDSIKETVEQAVEALFTHYNYGRANSERMMVFCRPAVEKYVYSKISHVLLPIYAAKAVSTDEEIHRKRLLLESCSTTEVFTKLAISEDFIIEDDYSEACEIYDRVEDLKSPIEKINCYLNMISLMKAAIIDYSKGKVEISRTQDEVKIISYVIIKSNVKNPSAEIELIKDYLGFKLGADTKGIVNINAAINYIISDLVV